MTKMIETTINGTWKLKLPQHRAERAEWKTGWEVERIASMMATTTKDSIIFDIGAEEGDMTALLATKAKGVVMFEPNPKVWPNIRAIWEANKLKRPLGWYCGFAANTTDENPPNKDWFKPELLKDRDGWPECAYGEVIGDHGFRHLAQETDATPQIKLDEYCGRIKVYPTMITMDVEGSELEVLKGAENILRIHRPLVYVSLHTNFIEEMYGYPPQAVHDYMEKLGYKSTHLATDHEEHWLYESA